MQFIGIEFKTGQIPDCLIRLKGDLKVDTGHQ